MKYSNVLYVIDSKVFFKHARQDQPISGRLQLPQTLPRIHQPKNKTRSTWNNMFLDFPGLLPWASAHLCAQWQDYPRAGPPLVWNRNHKVITVFTSNGCLLTNKKLRISPKLVQTRSDQARLKPQCVAPEVKICFYWHLLVMVNLNIYLSILGTELSA